MRVAADMVYDYGSEDSMSTTHLDWPFLIKVRISSPSQPPLSINPSSQTLDIFARFLG